MTRWTTTFAAFLCFVPAAMANQTQKNDLPTVAKEPLPKAAKDAPASDKPAAADEKKDDQKLVITDKTEVQLDGRDCKLADIPATASVISLEVAADKKTIVKIHFQSKK
ncbi:MAG TPA: hypothetical protein VMS17_13700 [Gemmataceae bacterium]|nr:hypothetical protein [Gemmataceae bacterium]